MVWSFTANPTGYSDSQTIRLRERIKDEDVEKAKEAVQTGQGQVSGETDVIKPGDFKIEMDEKQADKDVTAAAKQCLLFGIRTAHQLSQTYPAYTKDKQKLIKKKTNEKETFLIAQFQYVRVSLSACVSVSVYLLNVIRSARTTVQLNEQTTANFVLSTLNYYYTDCKDNI